MGIDIKSSVEALKYLNNTFKDHEKNIENNNKTPDQEIEFEFDKRLFENLVKKHLTETTHELIERTQGNVFFNEYYTTILPNNKIIKASSYFTLAMLKVCIEDVLYHFKNPETKFDNNITQKQENSTENLLRVTIGHDFTVGPNSAKKEDETFEIDNAPNATHVVYQRKGNTIKILHLMPVYKKPEANY